MLKNNKIAKIIFIISLIVFAFYLAGYTLIGDVYRYAVVGAIYELFSLPMLASLLAIPIISVLIFIKNSGKSRIYAALSVLLITSSIIIIIVVSS